MKYYYQRIKDLREDNDKRQANIAIILNEHNTQYQRWERGKTEKPVHILKKLCIFYNVSTDYILGFTNEKKPLTKQ